MAHVVCHRILSLIIPHQLDLIIDNRIIECKRTRRNEEKTSCELEFKRRCERQSNDYVLIAIDHAHKSLAYEIWLTRSFPLLSLFLSLFVKPRTRTNSCRFHFGFLVQNFQSRNSLTSFRVAEINFWAAVHTSPCFVSVLVPHQHTQRNESSLFVSAAGEMSDCDTHVCVGYVCVQTTDDLVEVRCLAKSPGTLFDSTNCRWR